MISREPTLERLAIAQRLLLEPFGLNETHLLRALGEIIASVPEGEGVAIGDMDPARLAQVRQDLPALKHRVM